MPRGPWIIALLLVVRACRADSEGCCGGNDDGCGGLLEIGDGDCDSDDDCAGALVCGADNCGRDEGFDTSAWPPESYCGWDTTDDCCCRVADDGSCTTLAEEDDPPVVSSDARGRMSSPALPCRALCVIAA